MVNGELMMVNVGAQPYRTKLLPTDSDGNQLGDGCMTPAAKPGAAQTPLRILLIGEREEDFFLVREILERNRPTLATELEQARSIEDARVLLQQKPCGLVLLEYETGDAESIQLVAEFLHAGVSIPFILLAEDADEKTVADIIESGTWNYVAKSHLDGTTLVRTIRHTLPLHSLQQEQQSARRNYYDSCHTP